MYTYTACTSCLWNVGHARLLYITVLYCAAIIYMSVKVLKRPSGTHAQQMTKFTSAACRLSCVGTSAKLQHQSKQDRRAFTETTLFKLQPLQNMNCHHSLANQKRLFKSCLYLSPWYVITISKTCHNTLPRDSATSPAGETPRGEKKDRELKGKLKRNSGTIKNYTSIEPR